VAISALLDTTDSDCRGSLSTSFRNWNRWWWWWVDL